MTPAPLSKVLKVVERITNVPVREENLDTINGVMEMLWRDEACRLKYFKADGCALVKGFTEPCRNNCSVGTGFVGVVMPATVINIRELMVDGRLYDITEERVDPACQTGRLYRDRGYRCEPKAEHLLPRLLEDDIPLCGDNAQVTFRSDCPSDCGKLVGLRYVDLNFNEQREDLELNAGRVATSVSVNEFLEITFPEHDGNIIVETADGKHLGTYPSGVLVPRHEFFRLEAGCLGMKVHYRAMKELLPYRFDTDEVPFSDRYAWRLAIKAYENADSMELTAGQVNGLARIFAQLAQVGQSDLAAENKNFNGQVIATQSRAMLGTARSLSRAQGYSNRHY